MNITFEINMFKPNLFFKMVTVETANSNARWIINSLTTKKQTTKFSSANFPKKVWTKLYHIKSR